VVKKVDAAELHFVITAVHAVAAGAELVTITSQNLVSIWLPRWPACMCAISLEETAWGRRALERKGREGGGEGAYETPCLNLARGT
jgi:hypothetical protein